MPKNMCPGCGNYLTEGADCPDCTMSDALVRAAELEQLKRGLPVLSDEMKAMGDAILRWCESNPNPVGLNLYGYAHRLLNLSAALRR